MLIYETMKTTVRTENSTFSGHPKPVENIDHYASDTNNSMNENK